MKVIYVGSMEKIAEFIAFNKQMELSGIICEKEKISNTLYTYSIVRKTPLYSVENTSEFLSVVNKLGTEYIYIMCSYGKRIPMEKMQGYSWYNIHYAALPKYKGRHPTYWATVLGERCIGISLHAVTSKFDEGKIIAQEKVDYYFWENETDLFEKLTQRVPKLLEAFVQNKDRNVLKENNEAYYYPPVSEKEITLDLMKDDPDVIYNKVRSQSRARGGILQLDKRVFRIFSLCFSKQPCEEEYKIIEKILYVRYRKDMTIMSEDYFIED